MTVLPLQGRSVLVVEDEPLIAMDMAQAFERAGARVVVATSLKEATAAVEAEGLSAAILDHGLGDGDSSALCDRLKERGVPFLIYSGYTQFDAGACQDAVHIFKPADHLTLVTAVQGLVARA